MRNPNGDFTFFLPSSPHQIPYLKKQGMSRICMNYLLRIPSRRKFHRVHLSPGCDIIPSSCRTSVKEQISGTTGKQKRSGVFPCSSNTGSSVGWGSGGNTQPALPGWILTQDLSPGNNACSRTVRYRPGHVTPHLRDRNKTHSAFLFRDCLRDMAVL